MALAFNNPNMFPREQEVPLPMTSGLTDEASWREPSGLLPNHGGFRLTCQRLIDTICECGFDTNSCPKCGAGQAG